MVKGLKALWHDNQTCYKGFTALQHGIEVLQGVKGIVARYKRLNVW